MQKGGIRGELVGVGQGWGEQHSWPQLSEPLQVMLKQDLGCSSCQSVPGGLRGVCGQVPVPPPLPHMMLPVTARVVLSQAQHPDHGTISIP